MLRVDLRDLRQGPAETVGRLGSDDPALAGLGLEFDGPVLVGGRLQAAGEGEYLWRGAIEATVLGECRRCLTTVRQEVDAEPDVLFSTDPDAADDPSVYPLAEHATHVDVTEAVREELALAVSPLILCREECAGLCPRCGADLNAGPCACAVAAEPV
jgi:uncharacterized protein